MTLKSVCFSALGNTERALADAERCLSLDRRCIEGYHRKAACLTDMMRYDDAISIMKEALRLDTG